MSYNATDNPDAITEDQIRGTALPADSQANVLVAQRRNAFAELMAPKDKQRQPLKTNIASPGKPSQLQFRGRDGLAAYTTNPSAWPASRVISYDDDVVIIYDMYPKAQIHLLLLPRNTTRQSMHPFEALDGSDPEFLNMVLQKTAALKRLAAAELRRRFARFSSIESQRQQAIEDSGDDPDADDLPLPRDYSTDIISGVHASPSMNHLHIHVLSTDHVSDCMRHRKHYNSFATRFLIPVEDFPLTKDDPRRHPSREGYLGEDLRCNKCFQNFGNKFSQLKSHLEGEFEAWKRI